MSAEKQNLNLAPGHRPAHRAKPAGGLGWVATCALKENEVLEPGEAFWGQGLGGVVEVGGQGTGGGEWGVGSIL